MVNPGLPTQSHVHDVLRLERRLPQIARVGIVTAVLPQLPDRIDNSADRSAELMLSRHRYFVFTQRIA